MKLPITLLAYAGLIISYAANATLINSGFEQGNLSNWSSSGDVSAVQTDTPLYSGGTPIGTVNPNSGSWMARLYSESTSAAELASIMGINEATLEASNGGINATEGSLIWQSTTASSGDTFTFNWNFVEQDYVPYDDWAFYGIQLNGGPTEVFKFASLATVGAGTGGTVNGWESLTVDITQTGTYTFYFGIVNALDTLLESTLFIDGIIGTGDLQTDSNEVSAPASLAFFALGLAGLVTRRRLKK